MEETGVKPGGAENIANLTAMIAEMQRRLQEQQEEIRTLRQQNQGPEVEVRRNEELLPPLPLPELDRMFQMYERFRRLKPEEFEGSNDPVIVEEWLNSMQIILDFLNLTDQDRVRCATFLLKRDARYWWETVKLRRNVA